MSAVQNAGRKVTARVIGFVKNGDRYKLFLAHGIMDLTKDYPVSKYLEFVEVLDSGGRVVSYFLLHKFDDEVITRSERMFNYLSIETIDNIITEMIDEL